MSTDIQVYITKTHKHQETVRIAQMNSSNAASHQISKQIAMNIESAPDRLFVKAKNKGNEKVMGDLGSGAIWLSIVPRLILAGAYIERAL
jgi:hypothetical protein